MMTILSLSIVEILVFGAHTVITAVIGVILSGRVGVGAGAIGSVIDLRIRTFFG